MPKIIEPLLDYVLVELEKKEETTKSGLITIIKEERFERGKVLAIGKGDRLPDGRYIPISVNVGDTIYFNRTAAIEIEENDKKYLLIKEGYILSIIK